MACLGGRTGGGASLEPRDPLEITESLGRSKGGMGGRWTRFTGLKPVLKHYGALC